ncbi:MAG: Tm-1-like ATP-binding domain-containing protein, partial [Bacteroidota bacterium]
MLGCFDTKAEDFAYLRSSLLEFGVKVISINTGVRGSADFPVEFEAEAVAAETDMSLGELRESSDRSLVVEKMGKGAAKIIARLLAEKKIDGAIGMGGGGGTYITLLAMQAIPIGVPKFCLS